MGKDSQRLEPIVDSAVEALRAVLESSDRGEEAIAAARLASSTLSTWAKLKQTESAREAIYFGMARELAEDKDQLAHYIEKTLPDVPLAGVLDAKKLPAPKKK